MKYIFLDFDGVLHGEEFNLPLFIHSKMLCDRIRPYKDIFKIVISSSWREVYNFEILIDHLDEDIQPLVIGVTPIHTEGFANHGRFQEIMDYCSSHHIEQKDWIAIDDMQRLFPKDCPNLILTNSLCGLTPKNLDILNDFLSK